LGQVLSVLGEKDAEARERSAEAFARAAGLPGASLQPLQGLIFLSARYGEPVDPRLWNALREQASRKPLGTEDLGALRSLLQGLQEGTLAYDPQKLGDVLRAAHFARPNHVRLQVLYATWLINVAGKMESGGELLRAAVLSSPENASYWRALAQYYRLSGQRAEALASAERAEEVDASGREAGALSRLRAKLSEAASVGPTAVPAAGRSTP